MLWRGSARVVVCKQAKKICAVASAAHPLERWLAPLHREADTLLLDAVPVVLVALVVRGVVLCGERARESAGQFERAESHASPLASAIGIPTAPPRTRPPRSHHARRLTVDFAIAAPRRRLLPDRPDLCAPLERWSPSSHRRLHGKESEGSTPERLLVRDAGGAVR